MINKFFLTLIVFITFFLSANAQTLNDARKLTEFEQFEAAEALFKSLLQHNPTAETYYYAGENLLLAEKIDEAAVLFNSGLNLDPNNVLNKIGLAKIDLEKYEPAQIKKEMDSKSKELEILNLELSRMDGASQAIEMKELGMRMELVGASIKKSGDLYTEAVDKTEKAKLSISVAITAAGPKNTIAYIEAADALTRSNTKDLTAAENYAKAAEKIDSKNADVKIILGDIFTERANGTLAADYYNQAITLDKNAVRAIVNKGKLYKRTTNYEGAAQEFQNAIALSPDYAPAHRELGETYFKQGKLEKAKEEYRKYLELSKNNCGARIRYASFLYLSKDYAGAIAETKQLNNCGGDNLTLSRVNAYSYCELKDSANAISNIDQLFTNIEPSKITALDLEYRGKIYAANKRDSLAIVYYKLAYTKDPSKTDLLGEMANLQIKGKKFADAIVTLSQKVSSKDAKAIDFFNLGRAYYFSKEFQKADSSFLKTNELSPKYISGWLWRAKANSQLDTTSELGLAKPFYEKLLTIAEEDSATNGKYNTKNLGAMVEAFSYLSYFHILKKEDAVALGYLKRKALLPLEADDRKNTEDAIKRLGK